MGFGNAIKIINNKYRQIKTRGDEITDEDRLKAYEKDIDNCEKGESKGGYSLTQLREIAINYFDLDDDMAKKLDKNELCTYVRKRINKLEKGQLDKKEGSMPDEEIEKLKEEYESKIKEEKRD